MVAFHSRLTGTAGIKRQILTPGHRRLGAVALRR
jgi:hypothetical protein